MRTYLAGEGDDEDLPKIPHASEGMRDGRNRQATAAVVADVRRWGAAGLRMEPVLYEECVTRTNIELDDELVV